MKAMRAYLHTIWQVFRKDVQVEWRGRQGLPVMLVFALMVVFLFNFALQLSPDLQAGLASGLLWVSLAFASTLGLNRSISLERVVEKMCHAPAIAFRVRERGYIDEGCWADLVILDLEKEWIVSPQSLLYKCRWSPFIGHTFKGKIESVLVSGHLAWHNGRLDEERMGERMRFGSL